MSMTFEPKQVPTNSWIQWLQIALKLITARWALNSALALVPLLLLNCLSDGSMVLAGPPVVALLLGVFSLVAESTDQHKPLTLSGIRLAMPGLLRLLGAVIVVETLLVALLGNWEFLLFSQGELIRGFTKPSDFAIGFYALLFMAAGWVLVPHIWIFLIPILVNGQMEFVHSLSLSEKGANLNRFVWGVCLAGSSFCVLLQVLHGLLAILVLPLTGAFLYVAYRHVYFGDLHSEEPSVEESMPSTRTEVIRHTGPM